MEKFGSSSAAITEKDRKDNPVPEGDIEQSSYALTIPFLRCPSSSPYFWFLQCPPEKIAWCTSGVAE